MAANTLGFSSGGDGVRARDGEKQPPPFRSNRYFQMNGGWYIALRGGAVKGPYDSQLQAKEMMLSVLSMRISQNWDTHSL